MVWPTASIPTYGRGVWLECNGQSFDRNRFPQLYEALGKTTVPNYQGMFLRGSGSQDYSQLNGMAITYSDYDKWYPFGKWTNNQPTTTKYSSGNVGEIQGDAVRDYVTDSSSEFLQFKNNTATPRLVPGYPWDGLVRWAIVENSDGAPRAQGHYVHSDDFFWGDALNLKYIFFTHHPKHYKYRLVSSGGGDDGETSYSLEEYTEPADDDEGFWTNAFAEDIAFQLAAALPVANEIRPVNVAVKFMIKAK